MNRLPADYDVAGPFEYQPLTLRIEDLQTKALANRPDLRAAQLGITAANSQYQSGQGEWKARCYRFQQLLARERSQRRHLVGEYSAADLRPQPGQYRAARVSPSRKRRSSRRPPSGQVLTDVKDAYEGLAGKRPRRSDILGPAISTPRRRAAISANIPSGAAPLPCSISWTPSAPIAPPNSLTARLSRAYLQALEQLEGSGGNQEPALSMTKEAVRARIAEIGIIPAVRLHSAEDALFAAEAICGAGIPIVEVTTTVPGAVEVIRELARHSPEIIVGAGNAILRRFSAPLPGRRSKVYYHYRLRPGYRQPCARARHRGFPGCLNGHGGHGRVQGWLRLCQDFSMRSSRRPHLHPGSQGIISANPLDRFWRCEPANCGGLHSGRSGRVGHRHRPDSPGRDQTPQSVVDPRIGPAIHQHRHRNA